MTSVDASRLRLRFAVVTAMASIAPNTSQRSHVVVIHHRTRPTAMNPSTDKTAFAMNDATAVRDRCRHFGTA
jgi:hypothetical protein